MPFPAFRAALQLAHRIRRPSWVAGLSSNGLRRTALAAAAVACVWFLLAAAWGIAGPLGAGHYAAMGGMGRAAENMIEWGVWGPYWEYTRQRPSPYEYYCHHPFG